MKECSANGSEEWMLSYKLIPEVSNEWKQLQRRMQVRQSLNGVFSTKHMQLQRFIAVAAIACVLLLSGTYSFYLYRNTETADNRFVFRNCLWRKKQADTGGWNSCMVECRFFLTVCR